MKLTPYQFPNGKVIFIKAVPAAKRLEEKMACALILSWLEQCEQISSDNFISYLRNNNATEQALFLTYFLNSKGIDYPCLKSVSNAQLKEILEIIRDADEVSLPTREENSFALPSSGDTEADLIADLLSIFNNEVALTLYHQFDVATIQYILKRMELQSKREELEKAHEQSQAATRLHQYRKSGAFKNAQWKDTL